MPRIVIDLEKEEYDKLLAVKGKRRWKDLLLQHLKKTREEMIILEFGEFYQRITKHLTPKEADLLKAFGGAFLDFVLGKVKDIDEVTTIIEKKCKVSHE